MKCFVMAVFTLIATAYNLQAHADVGVLSVGAIDVFNALDVQPSFIEDQSSTYSFKSVGGLRCVILKSKENEIETKSYCFLSDKANFRVIYQSLNTTEFLTEDLTNSKFQKSMKSVGGILRCSKITIFENSNPTESYDCLGAFQ